MVSVEENAIIFIQFTGQFVVMELALAVVIRLPVLDKCNDHDAPPSKKAQITRARLWPVRFGREIMLPENIVRH